ncbi:MAG: dipeptide epimerase [Candidatus Ancaeobacter aquaticus]|nr:dipeptide epimerase [Candidatus Ancaeobacter aquaticus]
MNVTCIDIYEVEIPFKVSFSHSLKTRTSSESIIVKITLDNGSCGYGEGLPREYVTGETTLSVALDIKDKLAPFLIGKSFSSLQEALDIFKNKDYEHFNDCGSSAVCAVSTAFLDAVTKAHNKSIADVIGSQKRDKIFYTGVISSGEMKKVIKYALLYRLGGFKYIKLKVGTPDDIEKLRVVRRIVGKSTDIRVDANCAWNYDQARDIIEQMKIYGVSTVEQPLPKEDIEGIKKLTQSSGLYISADESLTSVNDARMLAKDKVFNMFNIRLSKCSGIFDALSIYHIAKENNIKCQFGCQVGETSILSAAQRHVAMTLPDVDYIEGSYSTHLLKSDIVLKPVKFGYRGIGRPIAGTGLGIQVDETLLKKYTTNTLILTS